MVPCKICGGTPDNKSIGRFVKTGDPIVVTLCKSCKVSYYACESEAVSVYYWNKENRNEEPL